MDDDIVEITSPQNQRYKTTQNDKKKEKSLQNDNNKQEGEFSKILMRESGSNNFID